MELLFQTKPLSTALHFVSLMGFWLAALVFHGENPPVAMKLDDITHAVNSKRLALNRKSARGLDCTSRFVRSIMGALMEHTTFR